MPTDHRGRPLGDPRTSHGGTPPRGNEQLFSNDPTRKPTKMVMDDNGSGYEEYEDGSIVDLPRSLRS